jgi:desulfoferrodoxin (superoxide reductase-like protein)
VAENWEKQVIRLPKNHGWEARPGTKSVVMDRGAVRFEIPQAWVVAPGEGSLKFMDKAPPDDDCMLEASYMRLPPVDLSGLPVVEMLDSCAQDPSLAVISRGQIEHTWSPNQEIAWIEQRFLDPNEKREAISRTGLARGRGVQALFTFAYWPEDAPACEAVWSEVFRSLQLGMIYTDPTNPKGRAGKKKKGRR